MMRKSRLFLNRTNLILPAPLRTLPSWESGRHICFSQCYMTCETDFTLSEYEVTLETSAIFHLFLDDYVELKNLLAFADYSSPLPSAPLGTPPFPHPQSKSSPPHKHVTGPETFRGIRSKHLVLGILQEDTSCKKYAFYQNL